MHLVAGYCRRKPVLCVPAKGGFGEGLFRSAHIQFCDLAVIHAVTLLFPFFVKAFHSDTPKTDPVHHILQKVFEKYRAVLLKKHRRRFVKRNRRSSALQRQPGFRSLCGFSPRK